MVSVAGAGGKTTLVYGLAHQARSRSWRVLVTTTTLMGQLPGSTTGPLLLAEEGLPPGLLEAKLRSGGLVTVAGGRQPDGKLRGLPPGSVDALAGLPDLLLVEADGARGRSLKAPAGHEPVVPPSTDLFVVVAALDALGAPLTEGAVHRPGRLAVAAGRAEGGVVDADVLVAALCWPPGYPARFPPGARTAAFLNKAEVAGLAAGRDLAARLVPPYDLCLAGSAREGWAETLP